MQRLDFARFSGFPFSQESVILKWIRERDAGEFRKNNGQTGKM